MTIAGRYEYDALAGAAGRKIRLRNRLNRLFFGEVIESQQGGIDSRRGVTAFREPLTLIRRETQCAVRMFEGLEDHIFSKKKARMNFHPGKHEAFFLRI
jgi:hypothetical protein